MLLDEARAPAASAPPLSRTPAIYWAATALLAAALGLTLWAPWRAAPEPRIVTRQAISVPAGALYPILSRDGTRLAGPNSDCG